MLIIIYFFFMAFVMLAATALAIYREVSCNITQNSSVRTRIRNQLL